MKWIKIVRRRHWENLAMSQWLEFPEKKGILETGFEFFMKSNIGRDQSWASCCEQLLSYNIQHWDILGCFTPVFFECVWNFSSGYKTWVQFTFTKPVKWFLLSQKWAFQNPFIQLRRWHPALIAALRQSRISPLPLLILQTRISQKVF